MCRLGLSHQSVRTMQSIRMEGDFEERRICDKCWLARGRCSGSNPEKSKLVLAGLDSCDEKAASQANFRFEER